jgi:hypothetical protein
MITGIVFSNFVTSVKPKTPVGNTTGYAVIQEKAPVVPVYKQRVNING